MPSTPLSGLTIRSGIARGPDVGNFVACDLKREQRDEAHAYIVKWQAGTVTRSEANFAAHTVCEIASPQPALVFLSEGGEYGIHHAGGALAGDVFEDSRPPPTKVRRGGLRKLSTIAGRAHAVGYRGMAYRLDNLRRWTRIDDGLPMKFDAEDIDGFGINDLYAVGNRGHVWQFSKNKWIRREVPTNADLNAVKCADQRVFAAGSGGTIVHGREDEWEVLDHGEEIEDIWDLEWFKNRLYIAEDEGLWTLQRESLQAVDFGKDRPESFMLLSAAADSLWSIGEYDVMAFSGRRWTRIV